MIPNGAFPHKQPVIPPMTSHQGNAWKQLAHEWEAIANTRGLALERAIEFIQDSEGATDDGYLEVGNVVRQALGKPKVTK